MDYDNTLNETRTNAEQSETGDDFRVSYESVRMRRSFCYRLYPTAEQRVRLAQFVGATRYVYNLALEQRRIFGRKGRNFNFAKQGAEVTALRKEVDWIAAVPSNTLTQALRDLDRAYAAFFAGRSGYPTPRRKGVNDSFRIKAKDSAFRRLNARWSSVRVPNLGYVKLRHTRDLAGQWINVTISHQAGQWFAAFACEIEHEVAPSTLPAVGIDRGIANTIGLSTGELLSTPATVSLERRKKRAQRVLARRRRGSTRYRKQRLRVARISSRIARVRADWRHKTTTAIARRFGTVAIENLNTAGMMRAGRGLARSIAEQGWHAFERTLAYKLEERGGSLVRIHPAYTSQECSACGAVDKRNRESQSSFVCVKCGSADHADINAAKNILRRSTADLLVEGSGYAPDEARTPNHALAA